MQPQKSPERLSERGMRAEVAAEGRRDRVLVHNTIRTRVAPCVHASCDKREFDQERRRALWLETDGNVIGIERMSASVTGREQVRDRATA